MEFLSSTQALDLLRPLKPAGSVFAALNLIREEVPFAQTDRVFSEDIETIKKMIQNGKLLSVIKTKLEF